jgi:glycosyltransferase involved in cell wall biosynthesis
VKKHIVIDARIRRASTGRPVDRLLEYLQTLDNDHRYTILLEPDDDWRPLSRNFKAVVCKYRQFSFNPLQQITFGRQLYKLKPDLVHFTITGQQPLFYFGRQTTFTHDLTMFKYVRPGKLPKWLHALRMLGYRLLVWQSHRKAKKILVPSEYTRDAVAKFHLFTNRKLVVTYEASEPPLLGAPNRPEYAPDEFILYVGSAFPHKNLDRLIEAFGLLKETRPALKLLLVGKHEYHSKQLKKWAKNKPFFDDIVFTGFVSDQELKWLYTNALAYVFPSLSEGFGLPGLEAMVHGCPVVSSNATCLPEIYGDAAHYFDPEDIHEMAEKINDVITNKSLRQKLIGKGYEQVKKFSWKRMAEQTLKVYSSVLSED